MKLVLGRALFRAACCFLGVVIIIAGIKFMVRFQSGNMINILTEPGLGQMDRSSAEHLLGIDHPWYMDFWPF